ncbi:MAG: DUF3810 family protein [Trueperaceae bacterium]
MAERDGVLRRARSRFPWCSTILATFALAAAVQFAPWPARWIDTGFVGGVQPLVRSVTVPLVDALRGSVSAATVLLAAALLTAALVWGPRARSVAARGLGVLLALAALAFPLAFGLGYRATDVATLLGLPDGPPPAEVVALAETYALDALREASTATTSEPAGDANPFQAASRCVASFAAVVRSSNHGTGVGTSNPSYAAGVVRLPGRVKTVPAGTLLRFGFAGFVSPWLLEPHVDAGLPPTAALAVGLHELAHSAGFAPEADAEAVGLLAGLRCDDARVRYAASLRLASALAAAMPADRRANYLANWPERARDDADASAQAAARWRSPRLAAGAARAYDAYLRSQGSREGMRDYDRGTVLVVHLLGRDLDAPELSSAPARPPLR